MTCVCNVSLRAALALLILHTLSFSLPVGDFPRPNKLHKLTIRKDVQFQKILGFGGSFTDSFGINIASLSNRTQENLMK
jgi:hypothetical protein